MGDIDEGTSRPYDAVIVGGGIAGISLAYFLAERGMPRILLLEKEAQPAYHATGRSAASLVELDAVADVQSLKTIGARFLRNLPDGFSEHPVLDERGVVVLYREPEWSRLCKSVVGLRAGGMSVELMNPEAASALLDGQLESDQFDGAAHLSRDGFIDVHQLLSSYMRAAKGHGVEFRFGVEVEGIYHNGGRCEAVAWNGQRIETPVVIDAAGAWADQVASKAGLPALGLQPRRRSIMVFDPPPRFDVTQWPMVWCDALRIYFREDAGRILLCPMDEEPMGPCDAHWEEEVLAAGIERLKLLAPALEPRAIRHRWAGLRTFAPDRVPVVGFDPSLKGFFWLAGQGGSGIETSAALGAIAADLVTVGRTERYDAARLSPARFR